MTESRSLRARKAEIPLLHALTLTVCLVAIGGLPARAGDVTHRPKNIASCSSKEYVLEEFVAHETDLIPEHRKVLDKVASKIIGSFGFCRQPFDYVELRGYAAPWGTLTEETLQTRSDKRAEGARDHLRGRFWGGYDEHVMMRPKGFGGTDLFGDNDTRSGRAKNRRVVIQLCRTYERMEADIAKIKKSDFDVYPNNLKRIEGRCLTHQMKDWPAEPKSMTKSVSRQATKIFTELYGSGTEGCDPDRVRMKIARHRKKLKRLLFADIEDEYRDLMVQHSILGEWFQSDGHRLIYKTDTCKQLRTFRERAKNSGDILYCFAERINDPERFDLCLENPKR